MDALNVSIGKYFGDKQLYYITANRDGIPLLMKVENLILIYNDKEKAEDFCEKAKNKYYSIGITAVAIQDNTAFFANMISCGLCKFLLNGDGMIIDLSKFCNLDSVKIVDKPDKIFAKIYDAQPILRDYYAEMPPSESLVNVIKKLPKIHKKNLINSYVWCIICLIICVHAVVVEPILSLGALYPGFMGFIYSSELRSRISSNNHKAYILVNIPAYVFKINIIAAIAAILLFFGCSDKNISKSKSESNPYSNFDVEEYYHKKAIEERESFYNDILTGDSKTFYNEIYK